MGHSASTLYRINNLSHRFISIKILEEKRVVIAAVWPPIPGCLEMKREPSNLLFLDNCAPRAGICTDVASFMWRNADGGDQQMQPAPDGRRKQTS